MKNRQLMMAATVSVLLVMLSVLLPASQLSAHDRHNGDDYIDIVVRYEETVPDEASLDPSFKNIQTMDILPIQTMSVPASAVKALSHQPNVRRITYDQEMSTTQTYGPFSEEDWNQDAIGAFDAWDEGYTGKDVKVAVIDTGFYRHPEISYAGGYSIFDDTHELGADMWDNDHDGHGTHVAGILAAEQGSRTQGIAPDSHLYGVKVYHEDKGNRTQASNLIAGLEWAIKEEMDVITISSGYPEHHQDIYDMIKAAAAEDILIIAASGNMSDTNVEVDYPAAYEEVVAVSSVDRRMIVASDSMIAPENELSAPGENILSLGLNDNHVAMSGTSQATPHIAGIAALLMEKYPDESAEQIRERLQNQALDLGDDGRDELYGYGLVQFRDVLLPVTEPDEEVPSDGSETETDTDRDGTTDDSNDMTDPTDGGASEETDESTDENDPVEDETEDSIGEDGAAEDETADNIGENDSDDSGEEDTEKPTDENEAVEEETNEETAEEENSENGRDNTTEENSENDEEAAAENDPAKEENSENGADDTTQEANNETPTDDTTEEDPENDGNNPDTDETENVDENDEEPSENERTDSPDASDERSESDEETSDSIDEEIEEEVEEEIEEEIQEEPLHSTVWVRPSETNGVATIENEDIEAVADNGFLAISFDSSLAHVHRISLSSEQIALIKEKHVTLLVARVDLEWVIPSENLIDGNALLTFEPTEQTYHYEELAKDEIIEFGIEQAGQRLTHFPSTMTYRFFTPDVEENQDRLYQWDSATESWVLLGDTYTNSGVVGTMTNVGSLAVINPSDLNEAIAANAAALDEQPEEDGSEEEVSDERADVEPDLATDVEGSDAQTSEEDSSGLPVALGGALVIFISVTGGFYFFGGKSKM